MELTPTELAILAGLVPFMAQALKWAASLFGWNLGRVHITIVAYAFSLIFAFFAVGPELPPYDGDPMAFTGAILYAAGLVFGMATAAYNLVLGKLFETLGFTPDPGVVEDPPQ